MNPVDMRPTPNVVPNGVRHVRHAQCAMTLRMSVEERLLLRCAARAAGYSMNAYVRYCCGLEVPPSDVMLAASEAETPTRMTGGHLCESTSVSFDTLLK